MRRNMGSGRPTKPTFWLLACLLLIAPATGFAEPATPDETQILTDCRLEGEAGGLAGADLEQFVKECVADLLSVQLSNPQE